MDSLILWWHCFREFSFCSFGACQSGANFSARKRGFEAAARLFELADGTVDDDDDPLSEKGDKPEIAGKVAFKNCVFAYPTRPASKIYYESGDRDGFSLSIDSKTTVAFVGKSGCGKSTALQLLLRFYRVQSGLVTVDNHDVTEVNMSWLRDHIGYVGQMPVLFAGSVRDNIMVRATHERRYNYAVASSLPNKLTFSSVPTYYYSWGSRKQQRKR